MTDLNSEKENATQAQAVPAPAATPSKKTVSLSSLKEEAMANYPARNLGAVRLSEYDETLILMFTGNMEAVDLHYLESQRSYIKCNGEDCVLCQINSKRTSKLLLPVYVPLEKAIKILPISDSRKPRALLPQLLHACDIPDVVIGIRKEGRYEYEVNTYPQRPQVNNGAAVIKQFAQNFSNRQIDLTAVYQSLSNSSLKRIKEIQDGLALRGVSIDENN